MATFRRLNTARVVINDPPRETHVPETGAVGSVQSAEIELPKEAFDRLWRPENLERVARAYWRHLNRISLGLLRVVYSPTARTVVFLIRPLNLLRFAAPQYEIGSERSSVTWRIDRGLLVAAKGQGRGLLRISIETRPGGGPQYGRIAVTAEVRNFYPWLRGVGRFARFGTWLYSQTQVRIHALVTHGFLRSLARLDLPPSRIGVLRGEIDRVGPNGGRRQRSSGNPKHLLHRQG